MSPRRDDLDFALQIRIEMTIFREGSLLMFKLVYCDYRL
jgi:hypothetical protein